MAVPATPNFDQGAATSAIDQQKAALLAALAQGGSAMAQGQAASQAAMGASSQAAAQQAAARAVSPAQAAQATAGANQQGAYYQGVAGQQASAAQSFMSNAGKTNEAYMGQLSAAVPLVHEQTQQSLNSMQTAAGQAQADRDLRTQIAQMQLQQSKNSLAASDPNVDHRTPDQIEHDQLTNDLLKAELANGGMTPPQKAQADKDAAAASRKAALDSLVSGQGASAGRALLTAVLDKNGEPVDSYSAALARLNELYDEGKAKTPSGKADLDRNYMNGLLARLYGTSAPTSTPQQIGGGLVGRSGR